MGHGLGNLWDDVRKYDAKVPGSISNLEDAAQLGKWNPASMFHGGKNSYDVAALGSQMSNSPRAREWGRSIGAAIAAYFSMGSSLGAEGGAGAAGAGGAFDMGGVGAMGSADAAASGLGAGSASAAGAGTTAAASWTPEELAAMTSAWEAPAAGGGASADTLGLQQMGQQAGLSGAALDAFVESGGTLGSTAAGGGGASGNFANTGFSTPGATPPPSGSNNFRNMMLANMGMSLMPKGSQGMQPSGGRAGAPVSNPNDTSLAASPYKLPQGISLNPTSSYLQGYNGPPVAPSQMSTREQAMIQELLRKMRGGGRYG